tara:strand:- start:3286 stop:4203 length:918 start_codon:yes stop_codon:yes gene_type:complete
MSDTIPTFTNNAAKKYNRRFASLTMMAGLPECVLDGYPGLTKDTQTLEFASATFDIQRDLGIQSDGCFGPGTYKAILKEHDSIEESDNYVVFGIRRIPLSAKTYKVINFDQKGGLDLHQAGHFSARSIPADTLIMHWGGFNPTSLYNVMSGARKVSTHFGVGLDDGNQPVVYQYLDLKHKAWHAGPDNEGSIGVDICQQPVYKHIGYYQKRGYKVSRIHNPTSRGNKNIISLDPRIAVATCDFVLDLAEALNMPLVVPPDHSLLRDPEQYTLVGHHHLSGKKWDIACWWSTIFNGTHLNIGDKNV